MGDEGKMTQKYPLNLTEKGKEINKIHINIYFMRHLFGSFKNNHYLCISERNKHYPQVPEGQKNK